MEEIEKDRKMLVNPRISIIVPVYRAEKYLCKCIDSILAQTFRDFELLLIDDGSPDESGKICDRYAQKDSRVHVFHKSNGGVSSARQYGINEAKGEYTIHADPDDWVEPEMLEQLIKKAEEENADVVICDFYVDRGERVSISYQKPTSLSPDIVLKDLFFNLTGSCCNKLIRRKCYTDNAVTFPDGINFGEDFIVNIRIFMAAPKVAYLPRPFYHYVQGINDNSMSKGLGKSAIDQTIKLKAYVLNILPINNKELLSIANARLSYPILRKAFISDLYTSREYRQCYGDLKETLHLSRLHSFGPWLERLLIYWSCMGFYRPMFHIWKCLIGLRKKLV